MSLSVDNSSIDTIVETQADMVPSLKTQLAACMQENMALYDFNLVPFVTIDYNFIIQRVNFKAAQLIGRDRQTLVHATFLNYIVSSSQTNFQLNVDMLINAQIKQTGEIELLQKGGGKKQIQLEFVLLPNNLIRLGFVDMTQTQQLEMQILELKKSLNIVNNLFQNSTDAIASLNSELIVDVCNHPFSDLFANIFSIDIQVGTNIEIALAEFPDIKHKIITACHKALLGNHISVILENQKDGAGYYCYELDINYFYNQFIKKNALILRAKSMAAYKLEDKKQHEKQADIAHACRVSAMSEMASVFAHEINQPLTAIIAYSSSCLYLVNAKSDSEKIHSKLLLPLEKIAQQAEHAGNIIHSMKNIVNNGHLHVEKAAINLLIKETLSILKYEHPNYKLKISLNLKKDLPAITINKIHIMQVILNLARNSVEALQSVSEHQPELIIETNVNDRYIEVHVIDNGPGIPVEYQGHILNSYFSTKSHGTGIGLGVCRSLIEIHGGNLSVQYNTQQGAWFTFTLPIKSLHE